MPKQKKTRECSGCGGHFSPEGLRAHKAHDAHTGYNACDFYARYIRHFRHVKILDETLVYDSRQFAK